MLKSSLSREVLPVLLRTIPSVKRHGAIQPLEQFASCVVPRIDAVSIFSVEGPFNLLKAKNKSNERPETDLYLGMVGRGGVGATGNY